MACQDVYLDAENEAVLKLFKVIRAKNEELRRGGVTGELGQKILHEPRRQHFVQLLCLDEHSSDPQPIRLEDILQDVKRNDGSWKKCKKLFIIGPIGAGKTILMINLVKHAFLKEKVVIFLQLRHFSLNQEILPADALLSDYFSDRDAIDLMFNWITKNADKVAILIDSTNDLELNFTKDPPCTSYYERSNLTDIVCSLLAGNFLRESTVITSSRGPKIVELHPAIQPDRYILLDGLTLLSINDLLDEFLGKKKGAEVKETIKVECPEIMPLLANPFSLLAAAAAFQMEQKWKTMTSFHALLRQFRNRSEHLDFRPMICEDVRQMAKCFGVFQKGIVLPSSDLRAFIEIPYNHSMATGAYWQHFYAALHIAARPKEQFAEVIPRDIKNKNDEFVHRMLCGVMHDPEARSQLDDILEHFDPGSRDHQEKIKIHLEVLDDCLEQALKSDDGSKLLKVLIICKEGRDVAGNLLSRKMRNQPMDFGGIALSLRDVDIIGWVISLVKCLKLLNLGSCHLDGKLLQHLLKKVESCKLQVKKFCVADNPDIGTDGIYSVARLSERFCVCFLDIQRCKLTVEHLDEFKSGTNIKFMMLDASYNKEMKGLGMAVLGSSMEAGGSLILEGCKPSHYDVMGLCVGLESTMIKELTLRDHLHSPIYVRSLPELCHRVGLDLDLRGWIFTESQREEIESELEQISKERHCPTVRMDDHCLGPEAVAKPVDVPSTSHYRQHPSGSGSNEKQGNSEAGQPKINIVLVGRLIANYVNFGYWTMFTRGGCTALNVVDGSELQHSHICTIFFFCVMLTLLINAIIIILYYYNL